MKKLTSLLLALTLALALLTGCGNAAQDAAQATATPEASVEETAAPETQETAQGEETADGQDAAQITITFNVTDADGNTTPFELTAQEGAILGDVLLEAGLISQEEHDAGFVTVVNGMEANWDEGQAWWSLLDGEGQMTSVGISDITLADGDVYSFVYTVG